MPERMALDTEAFFRTESTKSGAGLISQHAMANISQLAALLQNLGRPAANAQDRLATIRGNRLRGDLEAALGGTGAMATGLGRVAASSARGATTLALADQRASMAQLLQQLALQGGLGILQGQIGAFTGQPRGSEQSPGPVDYLQAIAGGGEAAAAAKGAGLF